MVKNNRGLHRAISGGVAASAMAVALAAAPALAIEANASSASDIRNLLTADGLSPHFDSSLNLMDAKPEPHSMRLDIQDVELDPQILIANPGTPTTARDPVNITGVAQMVVDNGNGGVGLCTGSLINPRTVLFAAHCVNSRAATAYGANSGGVAIAFGFETNTRANAPGQVDELVRWLLGTNGQGRFQTNTAQALYNVNAVAYHPRSVEPGNGFLYADIAVASLDTPAVGIPTWSLLLSQLPQPTAITAASGTGYHVNLAGYGGNGTGTSGTLPIDFRRRTAENWLGALTSLDDFQAFLFGAPPEGLPQNLYWIDFDDPRRGTAAASPFDFNAFRDNALPREGTTAGGDSGGPLILDRTFTREVIIGVLSGGYTRFFNGQPANGFGTASFYQPLYLYWDWIAENNPYRYVSANAGSRNWNDPTHWITTQDPNYFIIGPDGQLINGTPSSAGGTTVDTSGKFGQACFQSGGLSECVDFSTGTTTVERKPIGTGSESDNAGTATIASGIGEAVVESAAATAQIAATDPVGQATIALPPASIANGLPGATNFVPNNTAGNRTAGILPRYFDVTLSAAGTTTLDSTVTIDRFRLNGAAAALNITSTGSLTSLIDVTQTIGSMQVNGRLTSVGDYFMMTGGLSGTGTVKAPFFTSVAGTISPGATGNAGNIGTLTIDGNVILSSATQFNVDVGNGVSDRLAITGNASLGGRVVVSPVPGYTIKNGDTYRIVTTGGTISAGFNSAAPISAILTPVLTTSANAVDMRITAGQYRNVIVAGSRVQSSYASILDSNRAAAGTYSDVFLRTDLMSAAQIQATFESLAPFAESTRLSMSESMLSSTSRFHRTRMQSALSGDMGGTVAMIGQPLNLAATATSGAVLPGAMAAAAAGQDAQETVMESPSLGSDYAIYLGGGYLNGKSTPMPTSLTNGRQDNFDGYFVVGGFEYLPRDGVVLGISASYSDVDANVVRGQQASGRLLEGSVYGAVTTPGGMIVDGRVSAGSFKVDTARSVAVGTGLFNLATQDDSLAITAELGLSAPIEGKSVVVTPRVAAQYQYIGFDDVRETGGGPALDIDRNKFDSLQIRTGLSASAKKTAVFRPYIYADFVYDVLEGDRFFGANFAGSTTGRFPFAYRADDRTWAETGVGLTISQPTFDFTASIDTTVGRQDFQAQQYSLSALVRF
ncbi:autotransporter domain-containing protein [Blastomonas sp. AAP53]|uniref:autotransporter domain-containing protein n=1 Tax=Blastomonas sp. AAP53 TaxID=1248760 RepID=UPI00187C61FB|nr:autotransporter domain-containing protein [Blastomonas sp. AAP53]